MCNNLKKNKHFDNVETVELRSQRSYDDKTLA